MTGLEKDLRDLLRKYEMDICEIHILFSNYDKNILEIVFEEMGEENGRNIGKKLVCGKP